MQDGTFCCHMHNKCHTTTHATPRAPYWHMAHARRILFTHCSHGTCTNIATCNKMAHAIIRAHGCTRLMMAHAHEHERIMHKFCHTPRHMGPHKQHGTSNDVTWLQMPRHITRPHNTNTPHAPSCCKMMAHFAICKMAHAPMATCAHSTNFDTCTTNTTRAPPDTWQIIARAQILPHAHAHLTHANAHMAQILNAAIILIRIIYMAKFCHMPIAHVFHAEASFPERRKLLPGTFPGTTFPTELKQNYSRSSCAQGCRVGAYIGAYEAI
jgi:hypothetical protein